MEKVMVARSPFFYGMTGIERPTISVAPGEYVKIVRPYGEKTRGNVLVEKENGIRCVVARVCLTQPEPWEQRFNERVESVDFWKEVAANNNAQTQEWIQRCMEQSEEIGRLRQKCGEL